MEFQEAIELIGRRWNGVIIRALMDGPARFSEIARDVPDLSDRLLTERVKELLKAGLIERNEVNRRQVVYKLTPKGRSLRPIIRRIENWAPGWK